MKVGIFDLDLLTLKTKTDVSQYSVCEAAGQQLNLFTLFIYLFNKNCTLSTVSKERQELNRTAHSTLSTAHCNNTVKLCALLLYIFII